MKSTVSSYITNALRITDIMSKPSTDIMPAIAPTIRAPIGCTTRSAQAPMATPPARVAF